jgi:hypothetical protein
MIEPVVERLAEEKGVSQDRQGVAFAKIEIKVGMGSALAGQYGIRATPTFLFFLDGEKVCVCSCGENHVAVFNYNLGFPDKRVERRKCT